MINPISVERLREVLELVISTLMSLRRGLVESFLAYFHGWQRGDKVNLLAAVISFLGIVIAIAIWLDSLWKRHRQRTTEICDWIKSFYQEEPPKVPHKEHASSSAKLEFYEGRSPKPPIENVILGFHAEREIFSQIINIISQNSNRGFIHIDIVGDRKQGKSTLLAHLALKLLESRMNTVLMYSGKADDGAFDWQRLDAYRKIKAPRWYRHILMPRRRYRFVVIIDDFLTPWEERPTPAKELFLAQIRRTPPSSEPVLLITSSHHEIGGSRFDLSLTAQDEERIVHKLARDEPTLVPKLLTVDMVRGSIGGHRLYKEELMAFLSLLVQEAGERGNTAFNTGVRELDLELNRANRSALKYIAACQLIDVEVPVGVLKLIVRQVDIDSLLLNAKGWLRLEQLSYSPHGSGLSLGAPYFATVILSRYKISDGLALKTLFAEVLNAMAKKPTTAWSDEEGEFVRHILYRLAKGRHFRFHGIDGIALARSLFGDRKISQVLLNYVGRQRNAAILCRWAGTAARVGEREQTRLMCRKILHQFRNGPEFPDAQAFVTLARALNTLPHIDLREEGLEVLNLEWLMQQGDDSLGQDPTRRINQAIHAYSDLLKDLGKLQEALSVLEGLPDTVEPDAMTTLQKAEILGMLGDARAKVTYEKAIELANDMVRRSPGIMVECLLGYAKFLSGLVMRGRPGKQPDEFYARAAEYEKYAPEKHQEVLSSWADTISQREPQRAFELYQKSLEIDKDSQTIHI